MTNQQDPQLALEVGGAVGPQIYRILRQRIIRNDLKPGARVSETEIAKEYSISRQPVREAFIKLSEEGLVEVRPQRGTFVRKILPSAVLDAQFVRAAIEAEIAKLLAAQKVDGLIDELRRQLVEQWKVAADDPVRFFDVDELFHRTLAKAAGKTYAWNVVEGVKSQMDRVRLLSFDEIRIPALIEQHAAIVDAIADQDIAAAEAAVREHLHGIVEDLPVIAVANPEFFEDRDN